MVEFLSAYSQIFMVKSQIVYALIG